MPGHFHAKGPGLMTDRWTSDILLTEQGVKTYSAQIRAIFRDHAADFRTLATEVRDDLVADPIPGDNVIQARLHAWQVSRALRVMARHAQAIVAAAKALEGDYRRICIELPQTRQAKAAHKELEAKAAKGLPGGVVNRLTAPPSTPAPEQALADRRPATPFGDLFREAR